ncbi:RanBP1 domain protein [Cooperia oncophora]
MSEHANSETGGAPPAKKMFAFRQSALAAKADQLWSQSKSGFGFGITPSTHVHLEKKSLDDVLGKMAAEKKLRQEQEDKGQPMFVFGSKISDRVVKEEKQTASSNGTANDGKNGDDAKPKTAEELFKYAAQQDKPKHEQHDFIAEAKEAAEKKKEHEKPSTSIVTVTTGEENDVNIFQTACKLHSFDKEKKAWVERGLAHIRINQRNEDGEIHHRIVARTTGNHRVVINSRVHADMFFERVDQKRLKISATTPDSNAMQIFLVTIGFSKTALNIDEFCAILDGILKKEKACESLKRKRKPKRRTGAEGRCAKM